MYTLLTTCPPYGSRNVGDELIAERTRALIEHERGETDFLTIFREEPLDDRLDEINATRAVLMPAFPIRDTPMHPVTYQLVEDLSRIRVPLIPIGANWNVYPGDSISRRTIQYSQPTVDFLRHIAGQVDFISCREYHVGPILARHGIDNTRMTGDPAWFLPSAFGRPMHRPDRIRRLVFSPPLSPFYADQACRVVALLARRFPDAERICAFHLLDAASTKNQTPDNTVKSERSAALSADVTAKNQRIREAATEHGYDIRQMAGNLANLDFYETCDFHVGYECHAHLNFFSRRRPSYLIAEDARGIGFNDTLGVGGFTGFVRAQTESDTTRKTITSGYATCLHELALAPPKCDIVGEIEEALDRDLDGSFRSFIGLPNFLDDVYNRVMRPFIQSLP